MEIVLFRQSSEIPSRNWVNSQSYTHLKMPFVGQFFNCTSVEYWHIADVNLIFITSATKSNYSGRVSTFNQSTFARHIKITTQKNY